MQLFRKMLSRIVFKYLVRELERGNSAYVFQLSGCTGRKSGWHLDSLAVDHAFWQIQKVLIQKHGYHECPHCYWSAECPDGHEECKKMVSTSEY